MTDHDAATDLTSAEAIVRDLAERAMSATKQAIVCCAASPPIASHMSPPVPYARAVKWCEENPA